jgi:hypothetical protein
MSPDREQAQELGLNLHGHPSMALADGTVKAVTRLNIRAVSFCPRYKL